MFRDVLRAFFTHQKRDIRAALMQASAKISPRAAGTEYQNLHVDWSDFIE